MSEPAGYRVLARRLARDRQALLRFANYGREES